MSHYVPPVEEIGFLLKHVFKFDHFMAELFPDVDADSELALTIMGEAGRFCTDVLQPLNAPGDTEGSKLQHGSVKTPKGFAEAYASFAEAGWPALSGEPAFGGQGLPRALQLLLDEMISATNLSFGVFSGLTRGASEAIASHASPSLKSEYLPNLVSGRWTGVMALTEASAGTDLSLLKTRAVPNDDGSFSLSGTKIFISSGDHDLAANIIHLVLARLPDAPPGVKGISLFLAPKFLRDSSGEYSVRNQFSVGALERKMGIHAQPTCVMNYDGAKCWLVGAPHRGLSAMFTMMNAERLFVGIQGLGLADGAYHRAVAYAKERLQGRSADDARSPVPIIEHPDVRRMLTTIQAFTQSARALAMWTAMQMDRATNHPDETSRSDAAGLVALLTPVIKASFTDLGFESTVLAQQVFGGHGYIRETGIEQFVRDARITQIYEGTNGIQALDLVTRKLLLEDGQLPWRFFALMEDDLRADRARGACDDVVSAVQETLVLLKISTRDLQSRSDDAAELGAAATEYLQLFALVSLGWMWSRLASAAANVDSKAQERLATARFFTRRILPRALGCARAIAAEDAALRWLS